MINKPMLVLSFGMVAVMEMQTALSLNRNVDRLVYCILAVGISLYIKNNKVDAIVWLFYQVSSMVSKIKAIDL